MALEKQTIFDLLYRDYPCVQITIRTDRGASLPEAIAKDPIVVLLFGWGLLRPPPGFSYDDKGVRGHLSFGGNIQGVTVPWEAVIQITAHRNPQNTSETCTAVVYWPEDFLSLTMAEQVQESPPKEEQPKKERPSWLKPV